MLPLLNKILGIATAHAQAATTSVSDVANNTGNEFTKLITSFLAAIPLWIAAIVVTFFTYVLAVIVKKSLEARLIAQGIEEEHKEIRIIAGRSAFYGVIVLGVTIALSIVGIDLKPIVAAGAFGLGFALQNVIMNLFSGMFILASRHYTIGDVITVNGVMGTIQEIQTRATIMKDFNGQKVVIPNSQLFSNIVSSRSANPARRLVFIQGVGYNADLKQVMDLTLAVIKNIPGILAKPKPSVLFYDWDDTYILFKIRIWIDSKASKRPIQNRLIMDIYNAYNEAGIDVPYPITTIHMDKGEGELTPQEEIDKKVKAIRARLKAKKLPTAPMQTFPLIPGPQSEMATAPAIPTDVPISLPVLPEAIQTTPNSPGQSWLQQALSQQVAATTEQTVTPPEAQTVTINQPATPTSSAPETAVPVMQPSQPQQQPVAVSAPVAPAPATIAPAPSIPAASAAASVLEPTTLPVTNQPPANPPGIVIQ